MNKDLQIGLSDFSEKKRQFINRTRIASWDFQQRAVHNSLKDKPSGAKSSTFATRTPGLSFKPSSDNKPTGHKLLGALSLLIGTHLSVGAWADGVKFHDIAPAPSSGLHYQRHPSPGLVTILDAFNAKGVVTVPDDLGESASKSEGSPGVAILDYDNDGDEDIYVTNGPGVANSLFKNQLRETGDLTFTDVGNLAGVAATDQDSTGVCFGDIDNDGDKDLYVLGRAEPNRLYENRNDGTFIDITAEAGMGAGRYTSQVCAMGDINGDGLLDIGVGNAFDWRSNAALYFEPFALNEPDQLFLNEGGNVFADVSQTAGIQALDFPPESGAPADAAGITLAMVMVDYDQDGDVDIVTANDQGGIPDASQGGVDRGFVHILQNDGTGKFTDIIEERNLYRFGAWMGLDFGDFNCDGLMDYFASNLGDYFVPFIGQPYQVGTQSSRWMLGLADSSFADPGVGDLTATPFGWGTAILDYDNDGDQDIVFHGGANMATALEATNPGVLLENHDCKAQFTLDKDAASATNHSRRAVLGVAIGDLNKDGFSDIVSVSNYDTPEPNPLILAPPAGSDEFDPTAFYVPTWVPGAQPNQLVFNPGIVKSQGSLSVEISSGDNANHWAEINVMGAAGITEYGKVNRDGIGAVVSFKPEGGKSVMKPALAGSSHASQNSSTLIFGMGAEAETARVDILWPGGVRNRLYDVRHRERVVFPEIPCSIDGQWETRETYNRCVIQHLNELAKTGILSHQDVARFYRSALRGYQEEHPSIHAGFPYPSRYLEVFGSKMHYVDVGEGDPIVLLHGNPTSSYLWRNVIPELSKSGRVVAVDLIGMGQSDKPDIDYRFQDHVRYLEQFIAQLGLENVTFVLHDWGSALGFHYASRHENNVKGLAFMEALLFGAPSFDVFPGEVGKLFKDFRTPGVGEQLIIEQNIFLEQVLPALTERELRPSELLRYREPFAAPESRFVIWRWVNELPIAGEPADNAQVVGQYNQWLQQTDIPKLLIYSPTGFTTSPALVSWAQLNLKNLTTYRLNKGLHYFQEDRPFKIGQTIREWYREATH